MLYFEESCSDHSNQSGADALPAEAAEPLAADGCFGLYGTNDQGVSSREWMEVYGAELTVSQILRKR